MRLADIMIEDPNVLQRHKVQWWIGSSGTFEEETRNMAQHQGVEAVSNLYGASEFGPFALSCSRRADEFHVAQGHVLVEVVDESGTAVADGRRGRIVVTHLCGMGEDGYARPHAGTRILRLEIGDTGTLRTSPCDCGLTTPRLRDIQRQSAG